MLSALVRRAVPATASRLSSATATGGARRAMGSAQSFVSFGAAVRCVTSCSEATDAVQSARTLPTVSASETSHAPVMCVLAGIWAMESSGYCTVDGLYACDVLVRSQSLTIHLAILVITSLTAAHRHSRQYSRDQVRFQRRELQTS